MGHNVRQCKKAGSVHSRVAVNVDHSRSLPQKSLHRGFKLRIPIQNVVLMTVVRVHDCIPVRIGGAEPQWAVLVLGTINHMCNPVSSGEARRKCSSGAHEDPRVEPRRRVTEILRNKNSEHYSFASGSLLMLTRRNSATCHSTPASPVPLCATARARRVFR